MFAILEEPVEIIFTEKTRVDGMSDEDPVQLSCWDTCFAFQTRQIVAWGPATDAAVRGRRYGCLVDDAFAVLPVHAVNVAPGLGENVMDVDGG